MFDRRIKQLEERIEQLEGGNKYYYPSPGIIGGFVLSTPVNTVIGKILDHLNLEIKTKWATKENIILKKNKK